VVGFDDIQGAAYSNPTLTTVRQPLADMGRLAAEILLERIEGIKEYRAEIPIEPDLAVRQSTAAAPKTSHSTS
jgi:LacI family transcriptional regulator